MVEEERNSYGPDSTTAAVSEAIIVETLNELQRSPRVVEATSGDALALRATTRLWRGSRFHRLLKTDELARSPKRRP